MNGYNDSIEIKTRKKLSTSRSWNVWENFTNINERNLFNEQRNDTTFVGPVCIF